MVDDLPNPPADPQNPSDSTPPINNDNVDTTRQGNPQQLFLAALGEKDREIARLQREAQERADRERNQQRSDEDQWQAFTGAPRDLIKQEVADGLKGVNEFINSFRREQEITQIKNVFRNQPQYAPIFQYAESHLDSLLSNAGVVNMQTMQIALMTVAGAIATGQLSIPGYTAPNINTNPAPAPTNNNNAPRSPVIPPATPRATPQLPDDTQNNQPNKRVLTENEHRLRRSFGMTEEQYIAGLNEAPLTVSNQPAAK